MLNEQTKLKNSENPHRYSGRVEKLVMDFCGDIRVAWWSAGITSAVASKIALQLYDNVELFYIETGAAHPDNLRFKKDCENWYGKKIHTLRNYKGFKNHLDVIRKTKYVNGVAGTRCTLELKKNVRYNLEKKLKIQNQIFGFEFEKRQINRAVRFLQQNPKTKPLFPLIEKKLTKQNCAKILQNAHIKLPKMYDLGYGNNNCVGCVKGGKGYWNKIRKDFPKVFCEMSKAERIVGHSCIKNCFLDKLKLNEGRMAEIIIPDCDLFCEMELADIISKETTKIIEGKESICDIAI